MLIRYLDKADRRCSVVTRWLVIYFILVYWSTLVVMAAVNVIYCLLAYGQINGGALYAPLFFVSVN